MTNPSNPAHLNIARPYALAAFDYARDKQQLPTWKAFLASASHMAREPSIVRLVSNPQIPSAKLFDLFQEVLASVLDAERKNFLFLLAQNKRLMALPDIAGLFDSYLAVLEKISEVRVITAIETKEDFRQKLARALTKRIQHEVTLHCEIDPLIIGGAIIHIGDRVIDGSIRGKLTHLLQNLTG